MSIDELVLGVNIALGRQPVSRCPAFDRDGNGVVSIDELVQAVNIALRGAPPTFTPTAVLPTLTATAPPDGLVTLQSSSPAHGEGGVAITRETILRFSAPLDPASVTAAAVSATYGGGGLFTRLHLSPDRRVLTVFYETALPASARVRVSIDGSRLLDPDGAAVDADGDGLPGGMRRIDFDTLAIDTVPGTAVCGRVFASELVPGQNGESINVPLAGVTILVDGREAEWNAVTDQNGNFRLEPAPAGRFFVFIKGTTVTNDVPPGAYYPDVGKSWESVPGEETNIGEIYLPLVQPGTLQPTSMIEETVVRFPTSVLEDFPEFGDVRLMVPADTVYADDGTRGGMVGIAPVAPDRIPSQLPSGLEFPLVITVQTDGAENFDQPVPVCFPNLPDPQTQAPLAPGAKSALWSFNHDTGTFEVVGSMTVTADGRLVCTDPGVGILAPGWHGTAPGAAGSGGPLEGPPAPNQQEKGGESPPPAAPSQENCDRADTQDPVVDPVYLFSGEFYEGEEDLRIKGRGLDFVWARKYRSKIGPNTRQGNGWDFSYNIFLDEEGADIVVCDGNSRRDRYFLRPPLIAVGSAQGRGGTAGRTWSRPEFFRELTLNQDGTYTMAFADGGQWIFHPLDGRPERGKVAAVRDRNGNQLSFAYDAEGRLATITDTLDRDITVAYNASGFIASVSDFTGRTVQYTYYQDGDAGGSFGDLRSVRSPVVSGTVNGNDFPNGKTRIYTYSKGFADARLNHNLLTITDGRRNDPEDETFGDGPYLENVYATATDPADVNYDRIIRQRWGGPNDTVDLVYVPLTRSHDGAVMKTIVNDRAGNVKEYFFDAGNRVVVRREHTGRADPDKPTTEGVNRPTGKLRATDPAYFETRYQWNEDSLIKRVTHPNGNAVEYVYESDLDPNAPPVTRGNLRMRRRLAGALAGISDQAVIEEQFEYDERFGCAACGLNFVTRHVDGRGNETLYDYDDRGNRIRITQRISSIVEEYAYNTFGQIAGRTHPDNGSGSRRRDEYLYYDSGPQRGYLRQQILDAENLRLTTTFEYDTVGNVIRRTDRRGAATLYDVNQLDQVVRVSSRAVDGVRYQFDRFYDANDNVVRTELTNVDETGAVRANPTFTNRYEHEVLNRLVRKSREVEDGRFIVTEYDYDANRNRTVTRMGEATAGRQPGNVELTVYDERDLPYRRTMAPGTAGQSTQQLDYDGNGNLAALRIGIESGPRVHTVVFDGYDRRVRATDPMGNVVTSSYDANGNLVGVRRDGEIDDVAGDADNVRLSEVTFTYDPMNRVTGEERAFFDTATQEPIGDGSVNKTAVYSDNSQVVGVVDDNGRERRLVYDTMHRLERTVDPAGNATTYQRDANSNVIRVEQVDKSDLGAPDETFVTTYAYDSLNRRTQRVDNDGNVREWGWDSRNLNTVYVDGRGNRTRFEYDGLQRPLRTIRELRQGGAGDGAVVGTVTTSQTWDDTSRLITRSDDNGHATSYEYDPLNRLTRTTHADGTVQRAEYDVHGNPVRRFDAIGSRITTTFDLLNRAVKRSIQRGANVEDTASERLAYDGLSRLTGVEDDDSTVTRAYDSESNVVRERLNGALLECEYDGEHNQRACTYPGGRRVARTYDVLDRVAEITDADGMIAAYSYIGPLRVERRDYGNGTRLELQYDDVRRITRTIHVRDPDGAAAPLDSWAYEWDPEYNQASITDLLDGSGSTSFAYDSLDRLAESTRTDTVSYLLDGVDNRLEVIGGAQAGAYQRSDVLPQPGDAQVNQYTSTPFDARSYDANGNLRSTSGDGGDRQLAYDYRNQMVRRTEPASGRTARFTYDGLGRRTAIIDPNGGITRFFYDGWRVVEEQDGGGQTQATYVHGRYVDEVLQMRRGGADFYYHADARYSVRAVTDETGSVVERYDYGDYGEPSIADATGQPRAASAVDNPYLFTGRRYDAETALYYYRLRYLDPSAGRFTARDPAGVWTDTLNRGNAYGYAGSNPASVVDPMGLTGLGVGEAGLALGGEALLTGGATTGAAGAGAAGATVAPGTAAAGAFAEGLVASAGGGVTGAAGAGTTGAVTGGTVTAGEVATGAAAAGGATVGLAVTAVVLATFGIVDHFFLDDALTQSALDWIAGEENMPDPWGSDNTIPEGEPVPEIDGEPIPEPGEDPGWDQDVPPGEEPQAPEGPAPGEEPGAGPGAGGDVDEDEDCEENERCPPPGTVMLDRTVRLPPNGNARRACERALERIQTERTNRTRCPFSCHGQVADQLGACRVVCIYN